MTALLVLTTTSSKEEALYLAEILLKRRLAACVQISSPVHSYYRWKGKIQKSKEWQLWIKTNSPNFSKLQQNLKKYHSYSTPEILAFKISKGSSDYLRWLYKEVKK